MAERKKYLKELYILALDSPEVEALQIQYNPSELNYSRDSKIQDIAIVGRNDDLHQYTGGSTSLSFDLSFFSQETTRQDVKAKIKWLESQMYSEGDRAPSRLKLVFGQMFRDEIWILRSMSVKYSVFEPASGWLPLYATASLTLVRDTETDLNASDIRNQFL